MHSAQGPSGDHARQGRLTSRQDALISALMARIEALVEQNAQLTARIAELEATLGLPPKTPDNSSTPPSKGQKPSGPSRKGEGQPACWRASAASSQPHRDARRVRSDVSG